MQFDVHPEARYVGRPGPPNQVRRRHSIKETFDRRRECRHRRRLKCEQRLQNLEADKTSPRLLMLAMAGHRNKEFQFAVPHRGMMTATFDRSRLKQTGDRVPLMISPDPV